MSKEIMRKFGKIQNFFLFKQNKLVFTTYLT